jgi:hypothetical protein
MNRGTLISDGHSPVPNAGARDTKSGAANAGWVSSELPAQLQQAALVGVAGSKPTLIFKAQIQARYPCDPENVDAGRDLRQRLWK